jgi:hypothetical protein
MIALVLTTLLFAAPAPPPSAAPTPPQQPVQGEGEEPASQVPPAILPDRPFHKTGLVVFMEDPDPELEHKLGEVVRSALLTNPKLHGVRILKGPPLRNCQRDCFLQIGIKNKLDVLVMVTRGDNSIGLSVFDVPTHREVSEESHATSHVLANNLAVAEQLACDYLVPAGCTGKVSIIAPPEVRITLDGTVLTDPLHVDARVGVRHLFATSPQGGASRPYTMYVLREENPTTYVFRLGRLLVFSDKPQAQDGGTPSSAGSSSAADAGR